MSLMAANEESDSSAILNGFWVTLFYYEFRNDYPLTFAMWAMSSSTLFE